MTRRVPGLEEALKLVPKDWTVWTNPDEQALPRDVLFDLVTECTGLLVLEERIDERFLAQAPQLRAVSQYGVGVDNIDLKAARRHDIVVTNLPDEVTFSTAELAIALLLSCTRRIAEADRWTRTHNPFSWTPTNLIGTTLQGKVLGLIGFGRIAQAVGQIAKGFQTDIIYTSRTRRVDNENRLGATFVSLPELLRTSDFVSLHVPGGEETRHLIGREQIELMKPKAVLVNTSRGSVINEQALVAAMEAGRLGAAGLDVFEYEPRVPPALCELDNVVLTPHIGTSTIETRREMTIASLARLVAALRGDEPPNRVA